MDIIEENTREYVAQLQTENKQLKLKVKQLLWQKRAIEYYSKRFDLM